MSRVSRRSENPSWTAEILSFKDLETLIPPRPKKSSASAVVYVTKEALVSEACEIVEEILSGCGVTFVKQDVVMDSKLMSKFEKNLSVKLEDLPVVFYKGKYLGGVKEVQYLKESFDLDYLVYGLASCEYGVCETCLGHRFILFHGTYFGTDLITCRTCHGTGLQRYINLYICLEAEDNAYIICTLTGDSLRTQLVHPPSFNIATVIYGHPSMGCGVYNDKIILAGGGHPPDCCRDCISYNMTSYYVTKKPIMSMDKGKYKPLVFQLNKRLCVCDGQSLSIEFYTSFLKTKWRTMPSIPQPDRSDDSLADYSCLVFGHSCLMSVPNGNATYINHCNYLDCDWEIYFDAPLPFTGLGTFYSQDGFDDFVMIYFKDRGVRVCQFGFSFFGESELLFMVDSSKGGGILHGYFADFGEGCFCLTAFDESYMYVYTFAITREGAQSDPLKVSHMILSQYEFSIDRLAGEDKKITSVIGCFAPIPNENAKSHAEEVAATHFKSYQKVADDYDPYEAGNV